MSAKYVKISVSGIVQGVGFRPLVYRIAQDLGATGWVKNLGGSVEIVLDAPNTEVFIQRLKTQIPHHCRIDLIRTDTYEISKNLSNFEILESQSDKISLESTIPKDMAICPDCLKEMGDKHDRHYRYPFTTCTNCGPRYSIIASLPYDRNNTSMAPFKMCQECQNEYDNPLDRRFAAQPNSCPKCGIGIRFYGFECAHGFESINKCIQAILRGEIVAIKGVGGFALVCDGRNDIAIKKLRAKKHRPKKPFALMVKNIAMALELTDLSQIEIEALTSQVAPIVLGRVKNNPKISSLVAPSIGTLGIILPYSGIHHLLFESLDFPIVFTSANISGEPIIASFEELKEKLGDVFESVLDYEREILHPIDDSVMALMGGKMRVIRLARGLAPLDIKLDDSSKTGLFIGLGAEQKSSLTYSDNNKYLISPFIGDLNNPASIQRYEAIFELFQNIYFLKPNLFIHDLHPDYHSSILGAKKSLELRCKRIQIQHHRAHFCAGFAEAMLQNKSINPQTKVLGIIWDGTGMGDDGSIWGGEIFLGNLKDISRVGHFETLPLIGGEGAIKKIYKIGYALALKYHAYDLVSRFEEELPQEESKILKMMFEKNINTIHTSSIGRLFDGIASLCGLVSETSYEGEAGMVLENIANNFTSQESYKFEIENGIVKYAPMILAMQEDILENKIEKTAKKFINTLSQIVLEFAQIYPKIPVIFSGGVFQNKVLCDRIQKLFEHQGREFYMHEVLPPNDACISFGQAVYAQYNAL